MKLLASAIFAALLPLAPVPPAAAHEVPDPPITHNAHDGVVKLYGAGGPDTAFRKVAEVFHKETGIEVDIISGPEPTWSKQAQANADILWGTAEEGMTALLETYKYFSSANVTPIYMRPTIIAVKKGNPKQIYRFEDLLKDGMRVVVTEGAGVANTSGTGTWEDVAGRLGSLDDVKRQSEFCTEVAHPTRFERVTFAFGGQRSIQLSYGCFEADVADWAGVGNAPAGLTCQLCGRRKRAQLTARRHGRRSDGSRTTRRQPSAAKAASGFG